MKRNVLISLALALAFVLGAVTMYLVMWYDVWVKLVEMLERITVQ